MKAGPANCGPRLYFQLICYFRSATLLLPGFTAYLLLIYCLFTAYLLLTYLLSKPIFVRGNR
jgi:hypothetical protein